jgi:HlyD family secretion protein
VQLSSEVIGRVVDVLVKDGDAIEKGQVLLRLDPSSYRAEVAQQEANRRSAQVAIERAQSNVENQQRNLERSRRLVQEKFIDASKYDESVHQADLAIIELRASRETLQQAEAMLSQARERLAKTEVRAPISGIAIAVQIKIGETAVASATGIAGSSLMTIANVASLMAEVNVDESDIARVAQGQSARVYPAAFADKAITGVVESVSLTPKVGTQGRSYTVKLRLDKDAPGVRTGMTCRVEIVTGSGSARPVVPIQAIMTAENSAKAEAKADAKTKPGAKAEHYVFAVTDGVVHKKTVELGLADDSNQEILKGLTVGDTVAVGPVRTLHELRDGDAVKPLGAGAAKASGGAAP